MQELKNNYIVTIYDGLSKKHTLDEIKHQLAIDTLNSEVKDPYMFRNAVKLTQRLQRQVNTTNEAILGKYSQETSQLALLSALIFDLMNKIQVEKVLSKNITEETNREEANNKKKVIKDDLEYNRELSSPKVFYLTSEHNDSAKDHKMWQARIFVDERWGRYIKNDKLRDEIADYILRNNIKTFQWVIGAPVWFITRPNCRHYYKSLYVDEVLKSSPKQLVEYHDMHRAIGDRQYLQTISHDRTKEWYDNVRNAQLLLEAYKQRLALHEAMYAKSSNQLLYHAIKKDKLLIRKWLDYLRLHKAT